jgi:6-phosphogluconate dehydrogenase
VEHGYLHCGPTRAGHFVKMVQDGIEYGITELWRRGSVISSWLLDSRASAFAQDPQLDGFEGSVADSGEGRWTNRAATEEGVPVHVLSAALFDRFGSRGRVEFANQVLAAMRFGFGGHVEKPSGH